MKKLTIKSRESHNKEPKYVNKGTIKGVPALTYLQAKYA